MRYDTLCYALAESSGTCKALYTHRAVGIGFLGVSRCHDT
jgi:hypothetical protein